MNEQAILSTHVERCFVPVCGVRPVRVFRPTVAANPAVQVGEIHQHDSRVKDLRSMTFVVASIR